MVKLPDSLLYFQILFERGGITKKTQSVLQHEMVSTLKEQLYPGLSIVYLTMYIIKHETIFPACIR